VKCRLIVSVVSRRLFISRQHSRAAGWWHVRMGFPGDGLVQVDGHRFRWGT